jgi:hypothetical protein
MDPTTSVQIGVISAFGFNTWSLVLITNDVKKKEMFQ